MATKRRGERQVDDLDVGANIGNGDPGQEAEGVAVRVGTDEFGVRTVYFLPVRLRNANPRQQGLIRDVQQVVRRHVDVLAELDVLVADMRQSGLSWDSIGWCVGISGQGARKRWGGSSPGRVSRVG
jgi:hypothetical protein